MHYHVQQILICSNIHINIDVCFNDMQLDNTPNITENFRNIQQHKFGIYRSKIEVDSN